MTKLLPPHLFILFILLMAALCWSLGSPHWLPTRYAWLGLAPIIAGLALAIYAKQLFKKHQTNILTFAEPDKLVTDGPYQYSRNPMYLGLAMALGGFTLALGLAPSSIALWILFLYITQTGYIAYEERAMSQCFGENYRQYCKQVRRWF